MPQKDTFLNPDYHWLQSTGTGKNQPFWYGQVRKKQKTWLRKRNGFGFKRNGYGMLPKHMLRKRNGYGLFRISVIKSVRQPQFGVQWRTPNEGSWFWQKLEFLRKFVSTLLLTSFLTQKESISKFYKLMDSLNCLRWRYLWRQSKKITLFQLTAIEGGHLDQQVFVCRLTYHTAGLRKETNKEKRTWTLQGLFKNYVP